MATINYNTTTLEKLDPPTSVAGKRAEFAEVTRVFERTDDKPEIMLAVISINILWDRAADTLAQDYAAKKAAMMTRSTEETARLDSYLAVVTATRVEEPIEAKKP